MVSANYAARQDLLLKPNQRLVLVHPTLGYLPFHPFSFSLLVQ